MSTKSNTNNQIICYHCGDFCKDESIAIEDKYFCCSGCKTVYEILNQGELCTYYNFQENPGISPKNFESKKFDYLDDTTTINKLFDFNDDKISKITFFIPQMHCSSCIWLLENLFTLNPAITTSTVNFVRKELTVKFLQKITLPLKSGISDLFKRGTFSAMFLIGILNGFLPCGLVYVALAGAITSGDAISGSAVMI